MQNLVTDFANHQTIQPLLQQGTPQHPRMKFGLNFSTAQQIALNAPTATVSWTQVKENLNIVKEIIPLEVCTIAMNSWTYSLAPTIVHSLRSLNPQIYTISTDILRAHAQKPGQISVDFGYTGQGHHTLYANQDTTSTPTNVVEVLTSSTYSQREAELIEDVVKATKDLEVALDRCFQVERAYLEKVRKPLSGPVFTIKYDVLACVYFKHDGKVTTATSVQKTDFCVAHVLLRTFNQFQFVEEWDYLHTHRVSRFIIAHSEEIE